MAFGFFRRRQKLVIIIMVVLMVTFLVGMQGFSTFFGQNPQKRVFGTTKAGEITTGDVRQATMDLGILARYVGLGLRDAEFLVLNANAKEPSWAYAILLAEAKASDMEVSDTEVGVYLGQMGWTVGSDRYESLTKALRAEYKMPTKDFHALVGRWMMIKKPFRAFEVSAPPSAPRVERLFRDLYEMIELRVVEVPAEKFVQKQGEPTEQQIDELFNEFRGVAAGTCADENALGFGYYQPDRVAIHYLLISKDVIARVTRVDETEARRHYRRNKSDFVKKVPVEPPEQKDKKKESKPDKKQQTEEQDKPVEYNTVQMTLTEAMPQIMAKLIDAESQRRMDKLVGTVQILMDDDSDAGSEDVYQRVMARLTLSKRTAAALATRIADVSIRKEPLSSAIDTLAASAGLETICYPWGRPVSDGKILPADKKVSLRAKQITLADALERIGKELKVGPIEWAMCQGFEGILFPLVAGHTDARMFPVSVATTGLLDEMALAWDVVLGRSFTSPISGGRRVASIAFNAEGLERKVAGAAVIAVGRSGPEMYVRDIDGKVTGRVLWQLSRIAPAHEPKVLTESLKRQVISDFKIRQAFATKAKAFARVIEADAVNSGLATAATAADLASEVTRLFARKRMVWDRYRMMWGMPPAFPANDVPLMELPPMPAPQAGRIREYIQRKVFALVPRNVEPRNVGLPYPDRALAVVPVAPLQAVFVVERIDYRPPVRSEYDDKRGMLALMLTEIEKWNARKAWFSYDNIIKRTGFEIKRD